MFGYIVINKPEMKIKECLRYGKYYCGLCHSMREQYGICEQTSLNYDATFACVLLTALYTPKTYKGKKLCVVHPLSKKEFLKNDIIDYIADMNIVLAYYKCLDDWKDDKNIAKLGYSSVIRKSVKKIRKKYPKKIKFIREHLQNFYEYESKNILDIDKMSGAFGEVMGEILAYREDEWEKELRRLGFYLGKFIYILDAYDDIDEDIKKNRFNPLVKQYDSDNFDEYVKKLLMMSAAELAKSFERLPIIDEVAILRNIIYSGIWSRYEAVKAERSKDE